MHVILRFTVFVSINGVMQMCLSNTYKNVQCYGQNCYCLYVDLSYCAAYLPFSYTSVHWILSGLDVFVQDIINIIIHLFCFVTSYLHLMIAYVKLYFDRFLYIGKAQ